MTLISNMLSHCSSMKSSCKDRLAKSLSIKTSTSVNTFDNVVAQPSGDDAQKTCRIVKSFSEYYRLGKEVMQSGNSHMAVHFATRKSDGLEVVVKLRFKPRCFDSKASERKWKDSMEMLMNLPHCENIATIYEVLEDDKAHYCVMEKVAGMDLFEVLAAKRLPVTPETGRNILQQLLKGLDLLHSRGILHKDLKMENVMYDATTGIAKIIDFDTVELCRQPGSTAWPRLPKGASVMGTNQYIAPETYRGSHSDKSDMFAVGVVMYKILTGRFPLSKAVFNDRPGENFVGSPKMGEISRKMLASQIDWDFPVFQEDPLLVDLLQSMTSKDASERPTASEAMGHMWFPRSEASTCASTPKYTARRPSQVCAKQLSEKMAALQKASWNQV